MSQSNHDEKISKLSTLQYKVTQEKHTEPPFTGKFDKFKQLGTYECVVCSQELFKSEYKFDSGCGWPAFFDSIDPKRIREERDDSMGTVRTEVLCAKCGSHLGHVFGDGPKPTGRRFCINSVSMRFKSPTGETIDDPGT